MSIINVCEVCDCNIEYCTCYDRTIEEYIMALRKLHQLNIYTVNESWCIQLFWLDICPNDIDVSCIFETDNEKLELALKEAFEWAIERS